MKVSKLMAKGVITGRTVDTLDDAAELTRTHDVGSPAVVDEDGRAGQYDAAATFAALCAPRRTGMAPVMRALFIAAILATSCGRSDAGRDDPPRQPPEPARFDHPAMVGFHMRRQLDDLRKVERLLIAGKLADARERAAPLIQTAPDPGMARWQREVDDVTEAARALVGAPSIDEACRREARLAGTCASCHLSTQAPPRFAVPVVFPPDEPTLAARMARHQWAADRLWEGVVGPSEPRWRSGLDVLANTPLPFPRLTDAPQLASQLQAFARTAIAQGATDSLEDRTHRYGEMLVMCAACHSTLHVGSAAR